MAYQFPGVTVYQLLTDAVADVVPDRSTVVIGGVADVLTYNTSATNKSDLYLGDYDVSVTNEYEYKKNQYSGKVDTDFTKIFFENSWLKYKSGVTFTTVPNSYNEILFDDILSTANGYQTTIGERGVRVGDVIKFSLDNTEYAAKIVRLKSSLIDNTVSDVAATPLASNRATTTASVLVTAPSAGANGSVLTAAQSGWTSPVVGSYEATYTITVSSVGSTLADTIFAVSYQTKEGSVIAPTVQFASSGDSVDIADGLAVTLTLDADTPTIPALGTSWTVNVKEAFTAPVFKISGAYTGTTSATYEITVVKGGTWAQNPTVNIRTTSGYDTAKNVVVSGASLSIALGARGLSFSVTGNGLSTGDHFTYDATAATQGPVNSAIISENFLLSSTAKSSTGSLYIVRPYAEIPKSYNSNDVWTTDDNGIYFHSNVFLTSDWTVGGAIEALPVEHAQVYIESRVWNTVLTNNVYTVQSVADIDAYIPGPYHPANPLKYGAFKALQNTGTTPVIVASVADPLDLDSWEKALTMLEKNVNAYNLVPLTYDKEVHAAVKRFVDSSSTPEAHRECRAYFPVEVPDSVGVLVYDPLYIENNPSAIITQNAADNNKLNYLISDYKISFIDKDIRPGDKVRINYNIDVEGKESYEEYTIRQVVNNTTLILNENAKEPVEVPQRFEIYRPLTMANYAEIITQANTYHDRRVSLVYPGRAIADGYSIEGYFLCAMVAALTSSALPQKSITQQIVTGITDLPDIKDVKNTVLGLIIQSGVTLLTMNSNGEAIVVHSVTSGDFKNLEQREEMLTRNFDDVTKFMRANFADTISNINDTKEGLTAIYDRLLSTFETLLVRNYESGLGGQIKSYTIREVAFDPVFENSCIARADITLPNSMNALDIYLQLQKSERISLGE
jgi:hypothetical protein